ncbi:hypothetical protein [Variovorax sp. LjRoot84]|uniref:hypothetical protein n=1 Tax=Variovorax sp. LjRoot84 TaxID=3342340 RepID=UPI003F51A65C
MTIGMNERLGSPAQQICRTFVIVEICLLSIAGIKGRFAPIGHGPERPKSSRL